MAFNPETFMQVLESHVDVDQDPESNIEPCRKLRRADLVSLCRHNKWEFKTTAKKQELLDIVQNSLVEARLLPESVLDEDEVSETAELIKAKAEARKSDAEAQARIIEAEATARNLRAETALKEAELLDLQARIQQRNLGQNVHAPITRSVPEFDTTRHVRMVPPFQDKDLDSFFQTFEYNAQALDWPANKWTILLGTVLKGKAQSAYSALTVTEKSEYDTVKAAIMKAYELVPEAYRQKFRGLKRQDNQTHVEYVRDKERLFDKWCHSRSVTDYTGLRNLVLLEDLKDNLNKQIQTHIDDLDVTDVHEAARRADDYAVTHKLHATQSTGYAQKGQPYKPNNGSYKSQGTKANKGPREQAGNGGHNPNPKGQRPLGPWNNAYCTHHGTCGHSTDQCSVLRKTQPRDTRDNRSHDQTVATVQTATTTHDDRYGQTRDTTSTTKATDAKYVALIASPSLIDRPDRVNVRQPMLSHHTLEIEPDSIQITEAKATCIAPCTETEDANIHVDQRFAPFVSRGVVSSSNPDSSCDTTQVQILRDTGASQSLILQDKVSPHTFTGDTVIVIGLGGDTATVPLHKIQLSSDLVDGEVIVGATRTLPVPGIDLLLGNDLAGDKVVTNPILTNQPIMSGSSEALENDFPGIFPACVVTRSKAKKQEKNEVNLGQTFMASLDLPVSEEVKTQFTRERLIEAQESDTDLSSLREKALTSDEAEKVPTCYYLQSGVLVRKWRSPTAPANHDWETKHQIVIPQCLQSHVLELAHQHTMAGHLGVRKTKTRVLEHFWWPTVARTTADHCRTCDTCQRVGKPNQKPVKAPLQPIPAFSEPFSEIILDCVGPLPKTSSGHEYLLTLMCTATRFPEAIPLRNITARSVLNALLKYFTHYGLPTIIRSDCGTNFTSKVFAQVTKELNIEHRTSSPYHPETQGALERYHQTLKTMLRSFVLEHHKDWDQGIPFLLFATRDSVQESLGFTPFELVFGHRVRGPLQLIKEKCLDDTDDVTDLLTYVIKMKDRLTSACKTAQDNLTASQERMKVYYDKDARLRQYKVGDQVLVLLPVPGNPLKASFIGPCTILEKIGDLDYVVSTPDRRKQTQRCHVNMLKAYHAKPTLIANIVHNHTDNGMDGTQTCTQTSEQDFAVTPEPVKLGNSGVLANLESKLGHLNTTQCSELTTVIQDHEALFPDVPGKACGMLHDVDVGDAPPIKQYPYRVSPQKREIMRQETDYMLTHDIIEPCVSHWSSPCLLVPKPDKSYRFCTDYRAVNRITKTDSYPMPRIDDLIDQIGNAKYVSKFDLLKGYWQIPLTDKAKDVSSFVTPDGLFRYLVTPFGMKNSGCTFQRFMNQIVTGLPNTEVYVDDIIIYTSTWEDHVTAIKALFSRLLEYKLTVNLVKSEFAKATVQFLGHIVGQGQVAPVKGKVEAINDFQAPENKKSLMRFLGMAGFYRKFCKNFSQVVAPLTELLKKRVEYVWSPECQVAFEKVKAILTNTPVLVAPDFEQPFRLYCDASDVGVGAVLTQQGADGIEHPVSYFSRKLDKAQKNYATVEKEALSLLLALKHYDVYLGSTPHTVQVFTDHNPLVFVHRMKLQNQRLLRWSLTLQEYNIEISHVKGTENVIADALSRA